ncbi:MAG TPA: SNF2-related protein, partial [Verrucomicrobiae bacterium]|nr:SNF2-related protein [Verrucomicrobiae bacterium]
MEKVELTDALFAKLAGWEAVKAARAMIAAGRVLSSDWEAPRLIGKVQEGSTAINTGLIIRSASDAENLCPCRDSRQRGLICAHAVAVGLHHIKSNQLPSAPVEPKHAKVQISKRPVKTLRRGSGADGQPLELFLILPPNFIEALRKGRVMLYVEGQWPKGRSPLNALSYDVPFTMSAQDAALLDFLESLNEGDTPAMLMLNSSQFAELLQKIIGHPRVTFGRTQFAEILGEPLKLAVKVTLEKNGEIVLRLSNSVPSGIIPGATTWVLQERTFRPVGLPLAFGQLFNGPMRIARTKVPQFLNLELPTLKSSCDAYVDFEIGDFEMESATPRFKLHLAGGLAVLEAKLECSYGDKSVTPGSFAQTNAFWLPDPESPTRYWTRNLELEQAAVARLMKNGFSGPDAQGLRHLKGQNPVLNFFAREYPRLEKEWDVTLEERLERSTQQNLERIEPKFQITPSGEEWFNLNVSYDTRGGEKFSSADIQRLLLSGQSHSPLKNGKFALLDTGAVEELQEVLLDCAPEQHPGGYRMDNAQAGFLDATFRGQPGWQVRAPEAWAQRAAQQSGEVKVTSPPLGALESVLRPYQKEGVAWLAFLRANGFGGILADEMGLGKTLQVLALLQSCTERKNTAAPSLVVCPTSLVFNWTAEAARFTPELRVLALHGPRRHEQFAQIPDHDLIITSYALLRRDAAT